jgi:hypothetical protein
MKRLAILTLSVVMLGSVASPVSADPKNDAPGQVKKRRGELRCELKDFHQDRKKQPLTVDVLGMNERGHLVRGPRFDAERTRELQFVLTWPTFPDQETARIELYNPDGHVYQELPSAIGPDGSGRARISVSGTWITERRLYGSWCAEVYLEGIAAPVAKTIFVLDTPGR